MIARLARSNPRNHFVVVNFLCAVCSNFRVFRHVVIWIISIGIILNLNKFRHVWTCSDMFQHVQTCFNMFSLVGQVVNSKSWVTWLSFSQFVYFFEGRVFTFKFLNDKIHNYGGFFAIHAWISQLRSFICQKNTLPPKNIQTEQN